MDYAAQGQHDPVTGSEDAAPGARSDAGSERVRLSARTDSPPARVPPEALALRLLAELPAGRARQEAAGLYWLAFRGKLGRVMGPDPKALHFIERVISADHALAAVDHSGAVVAVIGFRTQEGAFVGGTRRDLHVVYGRFGGFWRRHALGLLAQDLPLEDMAVDGLVVAPHLRGAGIGSALIEALAQEARRRGLSALRLDVVAANPRARALYLRRGFLPEGDRRSRLTALFFGFGRSFTMRRDL